MDQKGSMGLCEVCTSYVVTVYTTAYSKRPFPRFDDPFICLCRLDYGGVLDDVKHYCTTMTSQQPSSLSTEASRLFRVYRTIGNLLDKRGYMVPKEMREMTPAGFVAKFGDQPAREGLTILVVRECVTM